MENEQTPVLYDRKGLWLCKVCKDLMDSREQKTQFIWRGIAGVDYDWFSSIATSKVLWEQWTSLCTRGNTIAGYTLCNIQIICGRIVGE